MTKRILVVAGTLMTAALCSGIAFTMGYRGGYDEASQAGQRTLEAKLRPLEAKLRPFEAKEHAISRIAREFDVSANHVQSYTFTPELVPGTLSGSWRSSGAGWGGADNTISAFRLVDPNDHVVASDQRGESGQFVVKLSLPGTYTMFFDNAGLFRTTPRRIFLKANFHPD